jgi:hypothetical protein
MKICVIGSGFTGMLAAASIKRNYPHYNVVMIDSGQEMKLPGLGLSCPPGFVKWVADLLNTPADHALVQDILLNTNSVAKTNMKWQNFQSANDTGFFSGIPVTPAVDVMLDPGHTGVNVLPEYQQPGVDKYMLTDLWYELYQAGSRTLDDFQPEVNQFYWYASQHRILPTYMYNEWMMPSLQINSWSFGEWLKQRYQSQLNQVFDSQVKEIKKSHSGGIRSVLLTSGEEIAADFYLDCTGFSRLLGKAFDLKYISPSTEINHNTTVVVGNGYTENVDQEMMPYTAGYGMDYGWTFAISMQDCKSFGYNFDSSFITADQALEELNQLSDPSTRTVDPVTLQWTPGHYHAALNKNFALLGLASGFIDPFDANSVALQIRQIQTLIELFRSPANINSAVNVYNNRTNNFYHSVAERLEFHQALAPRNTSEYWRRNHSIARRRGLEDAVFAAMADPNHHTPARAAGTYRPYPIQLYLSESLYYGLDMSRRCRQSSTAMLQLADEYFQSFNRLNQHRAQLAPTQRQWYAEHGLNLDNSVTFRK